MYPFPDMKKMVFVLTLLLPVVLGIDYCQVDETHILCEKENERVSSTCPPGITFFNAKKEDKDAVSRTVNGYRSKVAGGHYKRGKVLGFKPAANMMEMEWDDDLASAAEGYIKKCANFSLCDECSTIRNFRILFIEEERQHKPDQDTPLTWDKYIQNLYFKGWSEENLIRDTSSFHDLTPIPNDVFVWAESYLIGCATSITLQEKFSGHKIVCAIGPTGPQAGKPIYLEGKSCTKCPENASCSSNNPKLCKCEGVCYPFNYENHLRRFRREDGETTTAAAATTTKGSKAAATTTTAASVQPVKESHQIEVQGPVDLTKTKLTTPESSKLTTTEKSFAPNSLHSSIPLNILFLTVGMFHRHL